MYFLQNGSDYGCSKSRNETVIWLFKNKRKQPVKENASCCCDSINQKKFILEIKDKFKEDAVIYNSLQTLNKTITFDNISNISISTTYSKMVIKNNNDYYIIIYDKNNYLYSTITHNNIIDGYSGEDSQRYLNYFLEYTTSRGRIPIMDSCMSSLIFLGRNPENLTEEDAKKIKWAYIYSGNIYEYKSSYNRDDLNTAKINLNSDLHPIDDNSTCVALIDYERLYTLSFSLSSNLEIISSTFPLLISNSLYVPLIHHSLSLYQV